MAWRKNKYNAKKCVYNGYTYDSQLEASYAKKLDLLKKSGEVIDWSRQHRFDLRVNGVHWRHYKIDFRVVYANGWIEYVEIKGFPTTQWKQKWDITKIIFSDLVNNENAKLVLNDKTEVTHYGDE